MLEGGSEESGQGTVLNAGRPSHKEEVRKGATQAGRVEAEKSIEENRTGNPSRSWDALRPMFPSQLCYSSEGTLAFVT